VRYYKTADGARVFVVFGRGDLLLEGLAEVAQAAGIQTATVSAGIGSLDRCHIHWIAGTGLPPKNEFAQLEGPLEVASMQGSVVDGVPHVHLCVSDLQRVYTGHLEAGSRVCYRAEVCLEVLPGLDLPPRRDPENNLLQIVPR
jgi:uncharacterized protein